MPIILSEQTIEVTSPAAASTVVHTSLFKNLKRFENLVIDASLVGATGGELDITLQRLVNGEYLDWYQFATLADGASAVRHTINMGMASATAPVVVGEGTTPALADETLTCPHPGEEVRIVMIARVGTSAGADLVFTITGMQFRD